MKWICFAITHLNEKKKTWHIQSKSWNPMSMHWVFPTPFRGIKNKESISVKFIYINNVIHASFRNKDTWHQKNGQNRMRATPLIWFYMANRYLIPFHEQWIPSPAHSHGHSHMTFTWSYPPHSPKKAAWKTCKGYTDLGLPLKQPKKETWWINTQCSYFPINFLVTHRF